MIMSGKTVAVSTTIAMMAVLGSAAPFYFEALETWRNLFWIVSGLIIYIALNVAYQSGVRDGRDLQRKGGYP